MKKLLYIDDEVGQPHFDSRLEVLREEGSFSIDAMGVKDGLKTLIQCKETYDGLLLDIIMEAEGQFTAEETDYFQDTGLRLLDSIRSQGIDMPVVVITIRRELDLLEQVKRHNVRDVIVKPLELSSLLQKIESALIEV